MSIYYVSTTGSDQNSGSDTAPFQTIQHAVDIVVPGDSILVRDGVYTPPSSFDPNGDMLVDISKAGAASAPITLKAQNAGGARLDGQLRCHSLINFHDSAAYWNIEGFDISQGYWAGCWGNSACHHLNFRSNRFHHIGNRYETAPYGMEGWYSDYAAHDLLFEGNVFHDIGRVGENLRVNVDHGIYSHSGNVTVRNNSFYNLFRGWGIQLAAGAKVWLIDHNNFVYPNPGRDGQIVLWEQNDQIQILSNVFYLPRNFAIATADFTGSASFDGNSIYGPAGEADNTANFTIGANTLNLDPNSIDPATLLLPPGTPAPPPPHAPPSPAPCICPKKNRPIT